MTDKPLDERLTRNLTVDSEPGWQGYTPTVIDRNITKESQSLILCNKRYLAPSNKVIWLKNLNSLQETLEGLDEHPLY